MSGEYSTRASATLIGRRLAYNPSPFLSPKTAFSGRSVGSTLSHFGPPTAPKSTASAFCAASSVVCGSGVPHKS